MSFAPATPSLVRNLTHAQLGARLVRRIGALNYDLVRFDPTIPAERLLSAYRSSSAVLSAQPNYAGRVAIAPGDSCLGSTCNGFTGQWHLAMTNAPGAWDAFAGRATTPVTIAVLDTHIDRTHPDFANGGASSNAAYGGQLDLANARDWVPSSRWAGRADYHGSFVAGLAAASTGNARDAASIGSAARILPITVVDGAGNTDAASLAEAIIYAWQRGARVINLSLGILGDSAAVHDAIRLVTRGDATRAPSLVVAAAGNNTGTNAFYPGSYTEVMSVSGTDALDLHASCSNTNTNVSVSAPADRLIGLTVMPTARIQAACGTSAAAPQVSGLAALLFMQDPTRTPAQVRLLIESSADDLGAPGRDSVFGAGRINAERALRIASGPRTIAARATDPISGTTTVTAIASAPAGVRAAQVTFDKVDATPIALQASDGSFGGANENLRGTLRFPAGTAPGAHAIWVRAFDGTVWGPASVGVVTIDARPPTLSSMQTTNAVRATSQALTVTFTASDDRSPTIHYGVEFRSQATNVIIARINRFGVAGGAQSVSWQPALTDPSGPYFVKLAVADEAGNVVMTSAGAVVT